MPRFSYQARDLQGDSQSGFVEAADESEAKRKLRADGLTVTRVEVSSELVDVERIRIQQAAKSIRRDEIIAFSAQLGVMLETGVPLAEALHAFVQQSKSGALKKVVEAVADRIRSGVAFSIAISEYPRVFPGLMVNLIRASEMTGALGKMLGRTADYLGNERRTRKQIKGALTYPMVMVGMALAVTTFLVGWVLPRFAAIYESRAAALPTPTRLLLDLSGFVTGNWIFLLVGVVGLVGGGLAFSKTPRGREIIDWLKINTPIIGPIYTNFFLSRAARTLGTLLAAGVTLPEAVQIVKGVTDHVAWRRLWDEVDQSMTAGRTVSEVLLKSDLAPPSLAQMFAAGERTGKLPQVLDRIASVTEEDLEEAIKSGTQMIEPLVITFMGVMIGGIAIALLLPIFTMGRVMGGG